MWLVSRSYFCESGVICIRFLLNNHFWTYHKIVTPHNLFRAQIWIAMLKCGVWLQIFWMILVCCFIYIYIYPRLYFKILVLENCFHSLSHSLTQSTSMWVLTQTNSGRSTFMSLDSVLFVRIRFFSIWYQKWGISNCHGNFSMLTTWPK